MKKILLTSLMLFCFALIQSRDLYAQGIARSKGLGLRTSFWNVTGKPTQATVVNETGQVKVNLSGLGLGFYFFSRVYQNWFLELNLGIVGGVQSDTKGFVSESVEVDAVMPLSLGLRYDVMANRSQGSLQPYLAIGGGPYWATSAETETQFGQTTETVKSNIDYGYYLGGGVNWIITSWFAFNFDLKHHSIDFEHGKDYSGFQFGLGFSFMWGHKQEFIEIKEVKLLVEEIYPAYHQFYNNHPIALVTVKNLIGYPIEVNVRCNIKRFSDRPKNSGFVKVNSGETKDILVTAFLGRNLNEMSKRRTAIMDLQLEAKASTTYKRDFSAELTIHSRNAWDGDMYKLGFFLTPEAEDILNISRNIVEKMSLDEKNVAGNFHMARHIFNDLSDRQISYHPDPNIPFYQDDRVQFASETLDIESGDCDDLVILYASLLESVGIKTAFVEVQDPEKQLAHLYLLFNSGLSPSQGHLISSNEKRYIMRENVSGQNSIWIPIETTLLEDGFEEAWKAGALAYLQEGVLQNGINDGWVHVIDNN